jgi:hypothetical protein
MSGRASVLAVLMAALAACGCGGGPRQISGTVSYRGRPLSDGTVLLLASDGLPYDGKIGPDGRFTIADVPGGKARVAVTSFAPAAEMAPRDGLPQARFRRTATPTDRTSLLPAHYGDLAVSPLTVNVEEDTELNLDLE